jgi:hypothetical protein
LGAKLGKFWALPTLRSIHSELHLPRLKEKPCQMSIACAVECIELLFSYFTKALLRYDLSEALVCSCLYVVVGTATILSNQGW